MVKFLAFLLLGVFYAFYIFVSAFFIMCSVYSFQEGKYYKFGLYVMGAITYITSFIELLIET